jgi:hypothetical protein
MATQAPDAAVSRWQRVQADRQEVLAGRGGAERSVQDAQEPARPTARAGSCRSLLALQQPHVGGLGAFLTLGDVELDDLPLVK